MAKRQRSSSSDTSPDRLSPQVDTSFTSCTSMRCFLPPHRPLTFASQPEYETHYAQEHGNRCRECQHNFPTAHLLDLHIAENHDPIVAARRERGDKTFACFVEGCEKVCGDWKKRRMHLVDKHGFPRNYDFFTVNTGVDGKRSMLRPGIDAEGHRASSRERRGSGSTNESIDTPATTPSAASPAADGPISPRAHVPRAPDILTARAGDSNAAGNSAWRGKKRSGSTRSSIVGAAIMSPPLRSDLDEIVKSMSALKMVPRSVAQKPRLPQT